MKYTWETKGKTSNLCVGGRMIARMMYPGFYKGYDGYCYAIDNMAIRDGLTARNLEDARTELINTVIHLYKNEIEGMEASIWSHEQVINALSEED